MKVLYLWAGKAKSGTIPWQEAGYEVVSVGIDPEADLTIRKDILKVTIDELRELGPFEFIWASPDCKVWSLANLHSGHWEKIGNTFHAQTEKAIGMIDRVLHTLELINELAPKYWVMENPLGILRKMPFMRSYQHEQVTYCQYGDFRMKPTDLWGRFPRTWSGKKCNYGDKCHEPTPRGRESGTQRLPYEQRVIIPYDLANSIFIEAQWSQGRTWPTLEDFA